MKKNMPSEVAPICRRVKEAVRTIAPDARVFLFGSRAKGRADAESDWDFFILIDQKMSREMHDRLKDSLYDIELETDTVLSSIVRTRDEWFSSRYEAMPLKQAIDREGVEL